MLTSAVLNVLIIPDFCDVFSVIFKFCIDQRRWWHLFECCNHCRCHPLHRGGYSKHSTICNFKSRVCCSEFNTISPLFRRACILSPVYDVPPTTPPVAGILEPTGITALLIAAKTLTKLAVTDAAAAAILNATV